MSPFKFEYLKRPTTWVVLLAGLADSLNWVDQEPRPRSIQYRLNDVTTGSWISYNAGTGEEAFFRGQLQPIFREQTGGPILANLGQAVFFSAGHENREFSGVAGLYLGWLTERNGYDLGEATFLHAWWDFLVINADLIRKRSFAEGDTLYLPPVQFVF